MDDELYSRLERSFDKPEVPIACSRKDLEDFRDGRAWGDIKNYLIEVVVRLRDELEKAGEGVDRNVITHIQAEIYATRLFIDMPDILINSLEAKKEDEDEHS